MSEDGIRASCSICVSSLRSSQKITALKCGHTFHFSCVSTWLNVKNECPICRKKLKKSEVIEKLFFDVPVNEDGTITEETNFAEKADQLAEQLSKEKEALAEKEKLCATLNSSVKALEKKVLKEKEKYAREVPLLKQRNQHLEMVASDADGHKKDLQICKAQLKACEFYNILSYKNGAENADKSLSRYLQADQRLDMEKFFQLMKSQNKELSVKRTEALKEAEKLRVNVQSLKKETKEKTNIIKALQKEISELRDVANIQTPINKRLRHIIDAETPLNQKRKSMGFEESNILLDEDSIFFEQENKKYANVDPQPSTSKLTEPKSTLAFLEDDDPPIFKKLGKRPDNIEVAAVTNMDDDADFSFDIDIPSTLRKRVTGTTSTTITKNENVAKPLPKPCFDDTFSPVIIKPKLLKRTLSQNDVKMSKAKKPAVKSHRLSNFFSRDGSESSNIECVTLD